MERFISWVKRQGDHASVTYSRFGLPGDEVDDRPPPQEVHVAPFNEDAAEFIVFSAHAQRAAIVSAAIGMSTTIFVFIALMFEFDWYNNGKGADIGALLALLVFLLVGVLAHWEVVRGIKTDQSARLVPFLIIYATLIAFEIVYALMILVHHLGMFGVLSKVYNPSSVLLIESVMLCIVAVQACMLHSVAICRNFLEKKQVHMIEMKVAELCKSKNPQLRIVFGRGDAGDVSRPAQTQQAPPQRTIFSSNDVV